MIRVGSGFDAHRFVEDKPLRLAGVEIPHSHGLLAHSDGDVALHALCDALLGGAALGDIGKHFPDSSAHYRGIDSRILLRQVAKLLTGEGYRINNIDLTIIAERPKLAPHIALMCQRIAQDLGIPENRVGVKATTTEGMGFSGRGEGIAAQAVALIESSE